MKKSKLLVLSLLAVSAISLTSCNEGQKGPKGDTGEQGQKGDTGNPGKDGKDGEDGKNFLNGEGVPSDRLGNDGDSYVDTKTFDYYVKESGKWVKKGSIKGDKGETGDPGEKGDTGAKGDAGAKGEKGDTGSSGSKGPDGAKGDTAWSNTILPSKGGYVTADKGSATTKDYVTFTIYADEGNSLKSFKLGDTELSLEKPKYIDKKLVYTTTPLKMQENGYVVSAEFEIGNVSAEDGGYVIKETKNGETHYTVRASEGYTFKHLWFGDYYTNYNNGVETVSNEDGTEYTYVGTQTAKACADFFVTSNLGDFVVVDQKTGTFYDSLLDSFPNGGSAIVRLVKDTNAEKDYNIVLGNYEPAAITNESIIIDLNGKKLTSAMQFNLGEGVKTFKITGYGTIEAGDQSETLPPYDTESTELAALNVRTGGSSEGATITIDKNVVINTSRKYGIRVRTSTTKIGTLGLEAGTPVKTVLDIKGSINTTATDAIGVYVEGGQAGTATDNIKVNVSGSITATNGTAIKLNAGSLDVTDGVITGKSALIAKQAEEKFDEISVNLEGGRFIGTDNTNGYAIYVGDGVESNIVYDVRKNASGNIYAGSMNVKDAAGLLKALTKDTRDEIVVGEDITLTLSEDLVLNRSSRYGWKCINANSKKVTIDLNGHNIKDDDGENILNLYLKNGSFVLKDGTYSSGDRKTIGVRINSVNANVEAQNVEFDLGFKVSHGMIEGNSYKTYEDENVTLSFTNCYFWSQDYGFATDHNEDSTKTNYGSITFNKCIVGGYDTSTHNCVGAMINSPYTTKFTECSFYGDRQCLIVRNSDVEVKDCTFNYNKGYTGEEGTWGAGNDVPTAMIVVGNKNSDDNKYYGDSKLTFVDTADKGNKFVRRDGTTNYTELSGFQEGDVMIYIAYDGVNATEVNMTNAVSTSLVDKAVISKETAEEGVTKTLVIKVDDAEQDIDGNKWTAKDSD